MALGTLIAGRYSGTYNSNDVGVTRAGYELQIQPTEEVLDESDAYGKTVFDWILRGGNCFLQFESREYKTGSLAAFYPGGVAFGKVFTSAVPCGVLASDQAKAFVLTSTANTPAASSPATLTGSKSLLAPSYDGRLLFDSRLRSVPVRLQLLPQVSSSDLIWFTTT